MSPEAMMELPLPQFAAEIDAGVPPEPDPERTAAAKAAAARLMKPPVAEIAREPLTPFLPWADDGRFPDALADDREPPLLVTLLREPSQVATLLLDPQGARRVVMTSLAAALFCSVFRAAWLGGELGLWLAWPALKLGLAVVFGAAAALGPIYAASFLTSARVPLGRLGGALLAALAAGSLLLAGLAPPVYLIWRVDAVTLGPYAVLAAFCLVALAMGTRIHRLLLELAAQTRGAKLSKDEAYRVAIVARVAWMTLALTTALAFTSVID